VSTPGRVTISVELGGAFGRTLVDQIVQMLTGQVGPTAPELTEAAAAELIKKSKRWLQQRRRQELEPGDLAVQLGGRHFYRREELLAWVDRQPRGTKARS